MTDLTFSVRCPRFVRKLITDVMRSELSLSYGSMDHPVLKTVRETAAKVAKIEAVLGTDSAEWKDKLHAEIRRSASAVGVSGKGVQSVSISRAPRSDALTGDTVRGIVREGVEQLLAAFQGVETLLEDRHRFEDARDAEQCDLTFARRLAAMQYRGREFSLNDEGHGGVGVTGHPLMVSTRRWVGVISSLTNLLLLLLVVATQL